MARLARLRLSMIVCILLVTTIFAAFLGALMLLIRLPIIFSLTFTLLATLAFILLQYLIGPAMVRWSTGLRYLKPSEHNHECSLGFK